MLIVTIEDESLYQKMWKIDSIWSYVLVKTTNEDISQVIWLDVQPWTVLSVDDCVGILVNGAHL